jgi:uncharacterized SAM-binding protein YcdF (DUF218 family)
MNLIRMILFAGFIVLIAACVWTTNTSLAPEAVKPKLLQYGWNLATPWFK